MSRNPNYADVVNGTVGRVLEQTVGTTNPHLTTGMIETLVTKFAPEYHTQDDFTVALLVRVPDRVTESVGVSKRNASDPRSPLRGKSLALARAVRKVALKLVEEYKKAVLPAITAIENQAIQAGVPVVSVMPEHKRRMV